MTEFLNIGDGQIAYDVTGEGPLIVLAHGMGDGRRAYRYLVPLLVRAGYRVAAMDTRGHGESSIGWASYTRADVAGDIVALVQHLGGPAVVVGHSFSGGAATIAAATHPELVSAIVWVGPFTRMQKIDLGGLLRIRRHRKGMLRLMGTAIFRSVGLWKSYLDIAYPGVKPADYTEYVAALATDLRRPGRMAVVSKMGQTAPADADAELSKVRCPAVVVMGADEPDWADPKAEAEGIVARLTPGLGSVVMVEGAGHYPHAQYPAETATAILTFLKESVRG